MPSLKNWKNIGWSLINKAQAFERSLREEDEILSWVSCEEGPCSWILKTGRKREWERQGGCGEERDRQGEERETCSICTAVRLKPWGKFSQQCRAGRMGRRMLDLTEDRAERGEEWTKRRRKNMSGHWSSRTTQIIKRRMWMKVKKKDWGKAVPHCYLMLLKTHFRETWFRLSSGTWGFRRSFMERKEATGVDCLVRVWKGIELKVEECQCLEICVELTGFCVCLEWEGRKVGSVMKQNQSFKLKKYISNGGIMMCTSGQERVFVVV